MSDAPLPNDPNSRSPSGEILEPKTSTTPEPKLETLTPEQIAAAKATADADALKAKETLLNQDDKTKKADDKADAKVVPDKYELKAPDGVTLEPKMIEAASAIFKELGLTQEQAQKLTDFHVSQSQAAAEAPFKLMNETREGWRKEVLADKEIGSKLPEVKASVSKAIDSLGPELAKGFREAMDLTGVGDHPAFIRAFYKLSQAVGEGKFVSGGGPSKFGQTAPGDKPASAAKALYPNLS